MRKDGARKIVLETLSFRSPPQPEGGVAAVLAELQGDGVSRTGMGQRRLDLHGSARSGAGATAVGVVPRPRRPSSYPPLDS